MRTGLLMRQRSIVPLAVLVLVFSTAASATNPAYLSEMPSAERLKADIKGSDPLDTLARLAGAAWQLKSMVENLADIRRYRNQLTPDEIRAIGAYTKLNTETANAGMALVSPDRARWIRTYDKYWDNQAFLNDLETRYFSASLRSQYQEWQKKDAEAARQRGLAAQQQREHPTQTAQQQGVSSAAVVAGLVRLALNLVWIVLLAGAAWWGIRALGRVTQPNYDPPELKPWKAQETRGRKEWLDSLGGTPEQRVAAVQQMFDRKDRTLSCVAWASTGFGYVAARITRNLAAMPNREREVLRTVELLNATGWDSDWCALKKFGLLWGDGKASIEGHAYSNLGATVTDAPAALAWFVTRYNLAVEGVVNDVLKTVEGIAAAPEKHSAQAPVLNLVKQRLMGGGAASLSSTVDFAAAQQADQPALLLGLSEETGKPVTFTGEGSAITIAPPGSGKTQCHVFPTLLTWKGPAVVLDVKGEIYAGTSKWRQENVGPVFKFSPLDPASSASWNPLSSVRTEPEYLWEDSRFLADMMMVPSNTKEPFWENRARDVLTAAIARTCLQPDPSKRSLADVLDVFHGVGWDNFVTALQMAVDLRSMTRAGNSLKEMEPKTRDGVLQTGLASLSAWDGDRMERATRKSDWSPMDLRGGKNPTIYICLKPNEVESYISVLRVFIAQHIRMLTAALPPRGAAPILFLLDELPRLRRMPPVEEALEIGRQYGIRLWMFAQSLGQLENAYENAEGMVGSCAIRMYMNPSLHDETAQKLSDQIGLQEGVLDDTRQKIVEAPVLAGPEYKDYVIVMASGYKPFRVRKNFAYADPTITSRMGSL